MKPICARCVNCIRSIDYFPMGVCILPDNPEPERLRSFPRVHAANACGFFREKAAPVYLVALDVEPCQLKYLQ